MRRQHPGGVHVYWEIKYPININYYFNEMLEITLVVPIIKLQNELGPE